MGNIEDAIALLANLASKPVLSKAEHTKVKQIMILLKQSGMTNEEISTLSKGRWTPSTVKFYTKGVKASEQSPWQDALALLEDVLSAGLSLDDVETAVAVFHDFKSAGVNLDQVIHLLAEAESASVDVAALIQQQEELRACDLSPKDVAEALALKGELVEKGLGLHSLPPLVKLAQNFGEVDNVLEAVSNHGTLNEIQEQIAAANGELKALQEQLVCHGQQLEELEASLSQHKQPLEAYEKAVKLGFGEAELATLSSLAKKYGGVKGVLEALGAYTDYAEITSKASKAKSSLADVRARIDKLEGEYAHLKTATVMCDSLIRQYKFGLDAVSTIFSAAKKYGEPLDALKAIEAFGKLQDIKQELTKLEAKVLQCRERLAELEGRYDQQMGQLEELNAMSLKVGEGVGRIQADLARSKGVEKILSLINDPASAGYSEYGPLVLAVAASIRKWVITNEDKLKSTYNMKSGLDSLIKELGGA